jgi:transcription elongation factor Elf1
MGISLYCCDCQECHSEILVNLESAHRPFGDQEKMLYRVVCGICGLSYDVHFEDLRLCDNTESEAAHRAAITSFGRR